MSTIESARADRLVKIRDLVVLGLQEGIELRVALAERAKEMNIFSRERDQIKFDYSSIYRYLETLRFLGLDSSPQYGYAENDKVIWSPDAKMLGTIGTANFGLNIFSEEEKQLFQRRIIASEVNKQFLQYFLPNRREVRDSTDFVLSGKPLYVTRKIIKRPSGVVDKELWPSRENVELSFDPPEGLSFRRPLQEFLYTYRLWCLDVGFVDELNISEAERCGIPKIKSYVIYPVNRSIQINPDQFVTIIRANLEEQTRKPVVIPVPRLMYQICPYYNISVDYFKALLTETALVLRDSLHLERSPGVLIKKFNPTGSVEYKDRYGNQRYYLIVNGTVRANLVIFPA